MGSAKEPGKYSSLTKKICVLCGGRSGERDVSLRSGENVYQALLRQGINANKMDTDDNLISSLKKQKIDAVFIALHGKFGEDGAVQGLLEMAQIPYTGSGVLASAVAMNKIATKRIFEACKIATPKYYVIDPNSIEQDIKNIKKKFPFPLVVKPTSEGSSLGISLVKDKKDLDKIIKKTVADYNDVFVEQFIDGQEVTVGIIGTGKNTQALPILELVPANEFYDYEAKYTAGMTDFILPANLPATIYKKTQELALLAHKALGCHGVSRVDIMVERKTKIPYVHEVNSIPGMTDQSDLPAEAKHAGISFDELVLRILESAFVK